MGLLTWLKNLLDPQPTTMGHNSSLMNRPSHQSYLPTKYNDIPVKYPDGVAKYDEDIAPPAYTSATQGAAAGPSRIPIQGAPVFPPQSITGPPPCFDADGVSPVFFGSAHLSDSSIHPCKIAPALSPSICRVAYGGKEMQHNGPYTILPFNPATMELVPTSRGRIPKGRRPVEGGYEKGGEVKLYHAVAKIPLPARGGFVRVPGKTNVHLSGCNVAWGGIERVFHNDYEILCWRDNANVSFTVDKKH